MTILTESGSVRLVDADPDDGQDWAESNLNEVLSELHDVIALKADFGKMGIALRADGTLFPWNLELGFLPVPEGLSGAVDMATSNGHFMAVDRHGKVWKWHGVSGKRDSDVPALSGEGLMPLDLAAAEGITDFVQLRAKMGALWVALRANGETVSNQPAAFAERSGIKRLGRRSGSGNNGVYIGLDGRATSAQGDGDLHAGTLPEVQEPVIDVHAHSLGSQGHSHALMLLESGKAIAWGREYANSQFSGTDAGNDQPWPRPDPADLENVQALALGNSMAAVLKDDGKVAAWGEDGKITLPEPLQSGIVQIAIGGVADNLMAIDSQNRVWFCSRFGRLIPNLSLEGVVAVHPGDGPFAPPLYQREDGSWMFLPGQEEKYNEAYPDIVAAMTNLDGLSPDDFFLLLPSDADPGKEAFLLWIEPVKSLRRKPEQPRRELTFPPLSPR